MYFRIWGLLCLCGVLWGCDESSDTINGPADATMPTADMTTTTTDMSTGVDQNVSSDAMNTNMMDMSADRGVPVVDANMATDAGTVCVDRCVGDTLTWGRIGGFTPYDVVYTVSPCNTQAVQIESFSAVDSDALRCERVAPGCDADDRITLPMVLDQLAAVAATNAFEFGNVFGLDSRPVDGQVFSIVFEGRELLIGDPCAEGSTNCTNPPAVVLELADLLWDFGRDMENTEPSCANIRDEL